MFKNKLIVRLYIIYFILAFSANTFAQDSGYALDFDGSDDYVDIGSTSDLRPTTAITVEAWVKPDNNSGWSAIVSNLYDSKNHGNTLEAGYGLITFDNFVLFWVQTEDGKSTSGGGEYLSKYPNYVLEEGKWQHIVGTYNSSDKKLKLYVNGVLVSSKDKWMSGSNGDIKYGGSYSYFNPFYHHVNWQVLSFRIGQYYDDNEANTFNGEIDEVRVWNTVRSQTQIRDNMCKKLSGSESGLLGYWKIDDGSGTTVDDLSDGNNGTMNNMASSDWIYSGAAIGVESTYLYTSNWSSQTVGLSSANKGNIEVSNVKGAEGIQVYRVDEVPNSTSGIVLESGSSNPLGSNDLYYGTFVINTDENLIMHTGTVYRSGGIFKDSGGDSDYQDDENETLTIKPMAVGENISVRFLTFETEDDGHCYDKLYVYDGETTSSILIGTYCGSYTNLIVTATNPTGALTFVFDSDGSDNRSGWLAQISCSTSYTVKYNYSNYSDAVDEEPNLLLFSRDSNSDMTWSNLGATVDVSNHILSKSGISTRGEFIITGKVFPLPTELVSFEVGSTDNQTVWLNWITASEINNDFFTVEHSSDGLNWSIISVEQGAGNSSSLLKYQMYDENPNFGVNYYRLKQTDFDGTFKYLDTKTVIIKSRNINLLVYPNPALESITIEGENLDVKQLFIYNMVGKNMTICTSILNNTDNRIRLNIASLPNGIYYIKMGDIIRKFVKQ